MEFEDYYSALDSQPKHVPGTVPPPPFVAPTRTDLLNRYTEQKNGFRQTGQPYYSMMSELPLAPMRNLAPMPYASPSQGDLNPAINADLARFGRNVTDRVRGMNPWDLYNASTFGVPGAILGAGRGAMDLYGRLGLGGAPQGSGPRFGEPMPGEAIAGDDLMREMKSVRDFESGIKDKLASIGQWFLSGYENNPTGFRNMPRSSGVPFFPESNTEVIGGPRGPEATPYPRPPFLNFRNWMETGERGPLPLESFRPGNYPAPANTPMPQAYDALLSGGMLA
jgi:hypothetical protein